MDRSMKLNTLSAALLCALPMTGAFAAALDRSGQSISSFLQPDNYFEVGVSALMPEVTGKETADFGGNKKIDNMAKDYVFANAAVKLQLNDKFSFGLIFDQPFGASAAYGGDNFFVANNSDSALSSSQEQQVRDQALAQAEITFNNLTAEQRVGAALKKQGVDLESAAGQAIFAGTLAKYNNPDASTENSIVKNTIDAGVKDGVNEIASKTAEGMISATNTDVRKASGSTKVSVTTENISMLFGYSPIDRLTIYGGPAFQSVKGKVSLRGQAYSVYNGYDADIDNINGWGWLAGAAYQIPEIALKASLTYRSEIDHNGKAKDVVETGYDAYGNLDPRINAIADGKTTITTPQSVNLDLQSGIMADTVAFANIRWVNWKDFAIRPYKFGAASELIRPQTKGFNLIEYSEDQWSVTAGVGRKFSEKWAGNVSVGWDSGAGNPVSTLGPTEGFYNVGLGVQFSPAANYFVAGGVKYLWLGDAKAQTGAQGGTNDYIAKFEDNNAVAVGLKMGYRF